MKKYNSTVFRFFVNVFFLSSCDTIRYSFVFYKKEVIEHVDETNIEYRVFF